MGYIDVAPTLREIAGIKTSPAKPYDGLSMLSVWKGEKKQVDRNIYLGYGSIISNQWKLVKANSGNEKMKASDDMLFEIIKDPFEEKNVRLAHPEIYKQLNAMVSEFDAIKSSLQVLPYGEGRKGFKAPKEWKITR
jgi:arylsulfatase B